MKTRTAFLLLLLVTCTGKIKAQSSLLSFNQSNTVLDLTASEKLKFGDLMLNASCSNSKVKLNSKVPVNVKVRIFNANGKKMMENIYPVTPGLTELNLNLSTLPQGAYFVQFYSKEGSALRQFVKNEMIVENLK
ncbi:MAG: hypothetical protein JWN78_1536 [Bacteroidota bacterium]|nr:hypothetical protein [Bacteroidota bacterium]